MENVTKLEAVADAHLLSHDPLEEILNFYQDAEEKNLDQDYEQDDESHHYAPKSLGKINFLAECEALMKSIETAQKKSRFYLNEILEHLDQDWTGQNSDNSLNYLFY